MSIAVTTDFLAGASIRTRAWVLDDAEAYVTPSTVGIQITNPTGATVVSGTTLMSASTAGSTVTFEHYYNSSTPLGWYNTTITVTDGTGATAKVTKGQVSFKVK